LLHQTADLCKFVILYYTKDIVGHYFIDLHKSLYFQNLNGTGSHRSVKINFANYRALLNDLRQEDS
jgi:hypothetical protein